MGIVAIRLAALACWGCQHGQYVSTCDWCSAAWLQLGERPTPIELVGMLFIALALVTISTITIRKHQQVDPAQGQE